MKFGIQKSGECRKQKKEGQMAEQKYRKLKEGEGSTSQGKRGETPEAKKWQYVKNG